MHDGSFVNICSMQVWAVVHHVLHRNKIACEGFAEVHNHSPESQALSKCSVSRKHKPFQQLLSLMKLNLVPMKTSWMFAILYLFPSSAFFTHDYILCVRRTSGWVQTILAISKSAVGTWSAVSSAWCSVCDWVPSGWAAKEISSGYTHLHAHTLLWTHIYTDTLREAEKCICAR